jgi:uncharacterized membrane protein YczE
MNPLVSFFIERVRRSLLASAGLMMFAFGYYLQIVANIGLSPWTALNDGLALRLPITLGQASIIVSILIVVSDLLMKERIGLGTLLDTFVVGWGMDLFVNLDLIPYQTGFLPGLLVLFIGTVAACVGQWFYMTAALSCGPRDAFLVALGKRLPRLSIGTVNILLLLTVAVIAFLLGGQIGVGTLITLFGTGVVMDAVNKIVKFEPRNVVHENLVQSFKKIKK